MIVFGTGHRPDKLGGYTDDTHERLVQLCIDWLLDNNPAELKVISGMAQGFDLGLADACIRVGVPFIAALPFLGHGNTWPFNAQQRLKRIKNAAAEIKVVCEGDYAPWKMQRRNIWMVDHAERGVGLWDGTSGGTANCMRYAQIRGKNVDNLISKWRK